MCKVRLPAVCFSPNEVFLAPCAVQVGVLRLLREGLPVWPTPLVSASLVPLHKGRCTSGLDMQGLQGHVEGCGRMRVQRRRCDGVDPKKQINMIFIRYLC
jgi:hypothetical protein